jgi:hypothetical protein
VSDVTISVQQERLTKLQFAKLQVMVQKQAWSYLGKKDNCTLWNYCNNLYITYKVLKLHESTGMLISVRMLRTTIASYHLPFGSFHTVYDIMVLRYYPDTWLPKIGLKSVMASERTVYLPSVSVNSKCSWRIQDTSKLHEMRNHSK